MKTETMSDVRVPALDLDRAYHRCQVTLNDIAFHIARLQLLLAQYASKRRRGA